MAAAQEFDQALKLFRAKYNQLFDNNCDVPPRDYECITSTEETVGGVRRYLAWYMSKKLPGKVNFLRLCDVPGRASGDVLRLLRRIPDEALQGDCELDGDYCHPLNDPPQPPPDEDPEDDFDDVSADLALLPLVHPIVPEQHFTKKCKYRSEILNLLKCQASHAPSNVVQLLGKTEQGELVFPRYKGQPVAFNLPQPLGVYRSWFLTLVDAIEFLHSIGIIHRDLHPRNLALRSDTKSLVVIDLETTWGYALAPELGADNSPHAPWSQQTDIWAIGDCMKIMLYGNNGRTREFHQSWEVPPPFTDIVAACQRPAPQERASLKEIARMLHAIEC